MKKKNITVNFGLREIEYKNGKYYIKKEPIIYKQDIKEFDTLGDTVKNALDDTELKLLNTVIKRQSDAVKLSNNDKEIKKQKIINRDVGKKYKKEKRNKIEVINNNENLTKRNIALEKRIGIKKNMVKMFEEFYRPKTEKVELQFENFLKIYFPDEYGAGYNWEKFKKTFYLYKGSLKV